MAALLVPVCVCLGLALTPAVASAQAAKDCDDAYGCTPTTPPPGPNPECSLSGSATVSAGENVTATLKNAAVGTPIDLKLDGDVVAHGVTEAGVGGSSEGLGGVVLTFTVSANLSPGRHQLVFVGAGVLCEPNQGQGVSVLGEVLSREGGAGLSRSSGGGLLARTGIRIALALAIALVLVVAGAAMLKAARRRRRRLARARNDVAADLVDIDH